MQCKLYYINILITIQVFIFAVIIYEVRQGE